MPTLVTNNVPLSLYDRFQHLAKTQHRTPADTVLEVLETAFRTTMPALSEAPLPQEPFLTEEISAPFTLPRPKGERVIPIEITEYIPKPHDLPDTD
jgi:hypothetical protein